ncbi:hypothetical protein L6164_007426 [Bauhinia variegata]|uniref:Uncharacterized protein n=1 Tax=Bauhinia variegata TaxID=167791 RepID=A0ACB9PDJ2_BAUVA|nr:hypothetical protein L6164_007426 [Bauhinia variegata]
MIPTTKRIAVQHPTWGATTKDHDAALPLKPITSVSLFCSCNTNSSFLPVSCIEKSKKEVIFSRVECFVAMEKSKSCPEYSCSYSEFGGRSSSYNFNGPNQKGNGFCATNDPELKRKKRIKSYNVFTLEGKLKTSVRNSFKWIKNKFSDVRYDV